MLCEPLLDLLDYHVNRFTPPTDKRTRSATVLRLLKLALMVALGLGVYVNNSELLVVILSLQCPT